MIFFSGCHIFASCPEDSAGITYKPTLGPVPANLASFQTWLDVTNTAANAACAPLEYAGSAPVGAISKRIWHASAHSLERKVLVDVTMRRVLWAFGIFLRVGNKFAGDFGRTI